MFSDSAIIHNCGALNASDLTKQYIFKKKNKKKKKIYKQLECYNYMTTGT